MKQQTFPIAARIFIGGALALAALFFLANRSGAQLSASEMGLTIGLGAAIGASIGLL